MSTRYPFAAYLFVCMLLAGCGGTAQEQTEKNAPPTFTSETLTLERSYQDCPSQSDSCAYVAISYPELNGGPVALQNRLNERIRQTFRMGEAQGPDAVAEAFLGEYAAFLQDMPPASRSAAIPWSYECHATAATPFPGILTLAYEEYTYAGGAHGLPSEKFVNLSTLNGQPLELEALLKPFQMKELEKAAEAAFREQHGLAEGGSINATGFIFEEDRFALPQNMLIQEAGLYFLYNVYEIAPYAAGPQELTLPYDQIRGLLDPEGPLGKAVLPQ